MSNLRLYRYLALIIIGFILLGLLFIALFSKSSSNQTPKEGPQPNKNYSYVSKEDQQVLAQDSKVAQLIKKLPFQGKYFKLEYSFSGNVFILTFNRNQEVLANNEFAIFLKDNQILSESWLQKLQKIGK